MNRYEKVKDFAKLKPPQRTWSQAMGAGSENQWVNGSVNPSSSPMIGFPWSSQALRSQLVRDKDECDESMDVFES